MSWKLLSFGIAIGACIFAYNNPTETSLKLQEFWHRTWFIQNAAPFLREQTHIVQHPPPKEALNPAQRAKEENDHKVAITPVQRAPVYFISHGGPPTMFEKDSLPYKSWESIGKQIAEYKPSAIVVASAHWEGDGNFVFVNTGAENPLIYDFYGFPDEYYQQTFTSKPDPALAEKVIQTLRSNGVKAIGKERGLDHGVWVPFRTMFNESTDIPIVQVSLIDTGDANEALKLGRALKSLRDERILLVGAGMPVHNLRSMAKYSDPSKPAPHFTRDFERFVTRAVTDYTGSNREIKAKQLCFSIPYRDAHPSPEHLWPLHFAIGAAGDDEGEVLFSMLDGSMAWGNYRFGQTDQVM